MDKNTVGEDDFEKCLKHYILDGQLRNNIFAIMRKYKDAGCKLKQILGTIFLPTPFWHYVHIIIDLEKKFILTKDPMGMNLSMQKSVSKIHMNIAKAICVGVMFSDGGKKGGRCLLRTIRYERKVC